MRAKTLVVMGLTASCWFWVAQPAAATPVPLSDAASTLIPSVPGDGIMVEIFLGIGGGVAPAPSDLDGRTPDADLLSPRLDFPHPGSVVSITGSFQQFFADTIAAPDAVRKLQPQRFILRNTAYLKVTRDLDRFPATSPIDIRIGIGCDDGHWLRVGNQFLGNSPDHGFTYYWTDLEFEDEGLYPLYLLFAANAAGVSGLEMSWEVAAGLDILPQTNLYQVIPQCNRFVFFEEFPAGTMLSDQYRTEGVLFNVLSGNPQITDALPTEFVPVSGDRVFGDPNPLPSEEGVVEISFVVPGTDTPAVAQYFSCYVIDAESIGATITAYDPEDQLIFSQSYNAGGATQEFVEFAHPYIRRIFFTLGNSKDASALDNLCFAEPRTIVSPDLEVTNLTTPYEGVAGGTFNVSWTVINTGDDIAPPTWVDRVYISTDDILDAGDTALGEVTRSSALAPGAFYLAQANLTYPSQPGTYWIIVNADANNNVEEVGGETNNARATALPVTVSEPPLANLTITSITPPPNAPPGSMVQLAWTVTNTGGSPAIGPWQETVYGSIDATIGGDVVVSSFVYNGPLAPGESVNRLQTVTVPAVPPGGYWVVVCIDTTGAVAESDEGDNCGIEPVCVSCQFPDLQPTSIMGPASALAGTSVNVSWSVQNNGSASANGNWRDRIVLSADQVAGDDVAVGEFLRSGPLGIGANYKMKAAVTIPSTVEGMQYFLIITDAANNVSEPGGEGNNALAAASPINVTLQPGPDLVVHQFDAPADGVFGQPVSVSWNVGNIGTQALKGAWSDRMFLSRDAVLDGMDMPLQAFAAPVSSLAVGDDYDVAVDVDLPLNAGVTAGTYYLILQTDNTNAVAEQREHNNTFAGAAMSLSLPPLPDLRVANITPPPAGPPGGTVTVQYGVLNASDVAVSATWTESVYASEDDSIGDDILLAVTPFTSAIGGNEGITRVQDITVPDLGFTYHVVVCLDTGNAVPELDDNNNCLISSDVAFIDHPDLTVAEVLAPTTAVADGPIEVTWTVENRGGAPTTGAFLDSVYLVPDPQTGPDILFGSAIRSAPVGAGESYQITQTFTVPGYAEGSYFVRVYTDSAFQIAETDDKNNSNLSADPTVVSQPPRPNLVPLSLNGPATVLAGSSGMVTWDVTNASATAAANNFWTDRLLAVPEDGSEEIILASVPHYGGLGANSSYLGSTTVTFPSTAGAYRLAVVVDFGNIVNEGPSGGEDDNRFETAMTFVVETYLVTVTPDPMVGLAGMPVTLTGSANDYATGDPLPQAAVQLAVRLRGTTRLLNDTTDGLGNYDTVFQPLPTEAGFYEVFAGPPNAPAPTPAATFTLHGMRAQQQLAPVRVFPGGAAVNGSFTLTNLGDLPLTGVNMTVTGGPPNLAVLADAGSNQLEAQEQRQVTYTLGAAPGDTWNGLLIFSFTSAQGATASTQLEVTIQPATAELVATPSPLIAGMLRSVPGQINQTNVEFTVTNIGGTESGPVEVQIPAVSWMAVATPNPLPSIQSNGSAVVTLTLSPEEDLPLGPYTGQLVLSAPATSTIVPFTFTNISDGVGDLLVIVEDEFTYYAPGAPRVADATVTLTDPYTHDVVAGGITDSTGSITFTGLPEAVYNIEVRAEDHQAFRDVVNIVRGRLETIYAFVSAQVVTYEWQVNPTTVDDRYRFVLETTFETNVPIPVVTVEPAFVDLEQLIGTAAQIDFVITNHGLITADDVYIDYAGNGRFEITPLVSQIGDLPALTSVTVPVLIEDLLRLRGGGDPCAPMKMDVVSSLVCGVRRYYRTPVSWSLPDSNCGRGGGGSSSNSGANVNNPRPPQSEPRCDCLKVAVVFFAGGYGGIIGVFGVSLPADFMVPGADEHPGEVAGRVFTGTACAEDQISSAEAWLRTLNQDPMCPRPKVIVIGHSLGGDTARVATSLPNVRWRIGLDPIARAGAFGPCARSQSCGGIQQWLVSLLIACDNLGSYPCDPQPGAPILFTWNQRTCFLPGFDKTFICEPLTIDQLERCGPWTSGEFLSDPVNQECLRGHQSGGLEFVSGTNHVNIFTSEAFASHLRQKIEELLGD